ncbi:hypothetical protein, partial [Staphylococcus capitis]|uniref:hypothetical protein n=1 Tax=Staphylococcus capitis TaxID=29388 RepID=UPI001C92F243
MIIGIGMRIEIGVGVMIRCMCVMMWMRFMIRVSMRRCILLVMIINVFMRIRRVIGMGFIGR